LNVADQRRKFNAYACTGAGKAARNGVLMERQ
jgi:hypothetical protein